MHFYVVCVVANGGSKGSITGKQHITKPYKVSTVDYIFILPFRPLSEELLQHVAISHLLINITTLLPL
jgi:hypothetical protein